MVRAPVVDKTGVKRGAWSMEEDHKLRAYVEKHGPSKWRQVPRLAGLTRCGKSCRLRWLNYLRPGLKRGNYTVEENDLICKLNEKYGNRWSAIATSLPGRTDNEIKNHWNAHLKKQVKPKAASSQPKQKQLGPNVTSQLLQPGHNAISETEAFSDYSTSQFGILESSPLSQETSSSCDDNFGILNWELEDHNGYGDFWTEPFIWDNRYVGQVLDSSLQLSSPAEYGIFSPHHETTYDDYIDLFCSLRSGNTPISLKKE